MKNTLFPGLLRGALITCIACSLAACGGSAPGSGGDPSVAAQGPGAAGTSAPPPAAPAPVPPPATPPPPSAPVAPPAPAIGPPPVISALNIHGAPFAGGVTVVIAGTGFLDASTITFGGAPATGVVLDPLTKTLVATVPPDPLGAIEAFVDVVVTNPDGQGSTSPGFHYGPPPAPAAFAPSVGVTAGTAVTIDGVDFAVTRGVQVSFGGFLAPIGAKTPTQLVVTMPKLNPGCYQVIVTNFDGQFGLAPGTICTPPGP